jgi:hypothetical protein
MVKNYFCLQTLSMEDIHYLSPYPKLILFSSELHLELNLDFIIFPIAIIGKKMYYVIYYNQ